MATISQHDAHHLVFGAGLIGCYLGACLMKNKQNVTLVGKYSVLSQLNSQITITDYLSNRFIAKAPRVVSVDSPELEKSPEREKSSEREKSPETEKKLENQTDSLVADILWLTVKCSVLTTIVEQLEQYIDESTLIICCQNGVSNHKLIQQVFPNNQVIRAMVPFNVVDEGNGHFHRGTEGKLALEARADVENTVRWLARQIDSEMLPVDISYQMTALQWAKLQLNLGNAVNALVDMPVKEMLQNRKYRLIIAQLMDELLKVTAKQQIKLPKVANLPNKWIPYVLKLPNWAFSAVAQKMLAIDPKARTSMWWDLQKGRKTEVDFINGKIVEEGIKLDVSTPANRLVTALIHKREQGKIDSQEDIIKRLEHLLES